MDMVSTVFYISLAFLSASVVHEFGHLWVLKKYGISVKMFGVGHPILEKLLWVKQTKAGNVFYFSPFLFSISFALDDKSQKKYDSLPFRDKMAKEGGGAMAVLRLGILIALFDITLRFANNFEGSFVLFSVLFAFGVAVFIVTSSSLAAYFSVAASFIALTVFVGLALQFATTGEWGVLNPGNYYEAVAGYFGPTVAPVARIFAVIYGLHIFADLLPLVPSSDGNTICTSFLGRVKEKALLYKAEKQTQEN